MELSHLGTHISQQHTNGDKQRVQMPSPHSIASPYSTSLLISFVTVMTKNHTHTFIIIYTLAHVHFQEQHMSFRSLSYWVKSSLLGHREEGKNEKRKENQSREEGGGRCTVEERTEARRVKEKIISRTNMALLVAVVETSAEEITPHLAHLSVILYSGTVIWLQSQINTL